MKIHEFQTKELLRSFDIPVPDGVMATTPETALQAAGGLGSWPVVVKAQIHAGGRGKGGGIKLAADAAAVREAASQLLSMTLVTPQTGPQGRKVNKILVEAGVSIARELYLCLMVDRAQAAITILASQAGGMDIEEVAATTPEKIIRVAVNPLLGLQPFHCRQVVFGLGLEADTGKACTALLNKLYTMFVACDCELLEINPLAITTSGAMVALDAKAEFDDNALFRHPHILVYRDSDEESPLEAEAARFGLNYINLSGNIGNMVNGAGLAMATMDIIKQAGAEPANFLDVGGGASAEMVENGLRIILGDPKVRGVLINIFGGILRCDILAEGVVQAARKIGITVPVVVRMEGTNVDEGRRILADSGLNLITAADLHDAAVKVAAMVQGEQQ
ncbi:MAG: ADP-forming succinate--CoA ligase subunit beta [Proteobacteria bacterium]|jgi:succinyl-CoA synthetase beta subunit|nr:ADP-forming succinate--CoA ligase subunit beta [Desulfocapsa sp.]MBU3945247.1 ADP-forming succinate--CoA ligase subunit beta [Pseudomonadota bacterium]MCG2742428.1 ADP-forming succinate--CoA ligase subunit beta [Desulfobacteraceae bacterium]MBU3983325.1 ADP-forming succinate--CoA ligase subunit beta [Pseudomonadota bacterium]MBU4084392.1 ADP-forming succinate--CoA ligase subunit beta [Pseudomonadota bacterium]